MMQPKATRGPALVMALLTTAMLTACDSPPTYRSEEGRIGFRAEGLDGELAPAPTDRIDAVVQSEVCLEFDGWFSDDGSKYHIRSSAPDDSWLRSCFDLEPAAGLRLEGSCLTLETAGESALQLSPKTCELVAAEDFDDDTMPVQAFAVDELLLAYDDIGARVVLAQHPGPKGTFGIPPTRPAGSPMRVLADAEASVVMQPVVKGQPTRTVAFSGAQESSVGDTPTAFMPSGSGYAGVTLAVDQSVRMQLVLPAGTLEGDEVVGVDPALATGLEIIVGYAPCDACDDGYGVPTHATSIITDDAGAPLYGGDVKWSTEGTGVSVDDSLGLSSLVGLNGACDDNDEGTARTATLHAELGDLAASVQISYTCPEIGSQDGWDVEVVDGDPDDGSLSCGCDAGRRDVPIAALGVVMLGLLARRRRR